VTYTTSQGDTWDSIAYKLYSKGAMMTILMIANQTLIDTVIFEAGVTITVPDISAAETSSTLPPWKRSDPP
jgi:phage tail protein X